MYHDQYYRYKDQVKSYYERAIANNERLGYEAQELYSSIRGEFTEAFCDVQEHRNRKLEEEVRQKDEEIKKQAAPPSSICTILSVTDIKYDNPLLNSDELYRAQDFVCKIFGYDYANKLLDFAVELPDISPNMLFFLPDISPNRRVFI